MAVIRHPDGTLKLAREIIDGDKDAALELCRRLDGWEFTAIVRAFFTGHLHKNGLFDRLCDAYDTVRRERELAALDRQLVDA